MTASPAPLATDGAPLVVPVPLAGKAYDILIGPGLVARAGAEIAARFGAVAVTIVTDEAVAAHHLGPLAESFAAAGLAHESVVLPPGEQTKSFASLEHVVDAVLAQRRERGDLVVALGGGVIGDLAGFVAAIVRRGMRFVQIPTTLLSQVDSSVGGKTGINTPRGKNLVGAFHQPSLVLADTATLTTLSPRHVRAGYAEIAKYGLIDDPDLFAWLEANHGAVTGLDPAALAHAVAASCRAKARVVVEDEFETEGARALLNLGHTFGHALETATGYGERLIHGEAVAIGVALAFRFSAQLGLCPPEDAARVAAHLHAAGLPTRLSDVPGDLPDDAALVALMAQDKKVKRGKLTFILARGIGQSFIANDVDPAAVTAFLGTERGR
ncbi:3-dehydroquinate synthase [Segnochrobactrum spirostomi]|uniref:3-dehydroquinate synthase n=1 Tax=Segnochrobactrum spirostomi TaxID=2608987 RepID=A0A6A7Y1B1_9HYPH|nr:3-dehydroquinate synthase [Segnochrobactrum spirostomi]MQT12850.1 3-dehydroquinate synthase [Segnochrobactrum spirostomi]